ncbi:MAG: T9SS type A sorting domain-containing protein, partial [Flavobacteriales bacterium]
PNQELIFVLEELNEVSTYRITNLKGQQVLAGNIHQNQTVVDLYGLASGIYVLQVVLNNGEQKAEQFVVY